MFSFNVIKKYTEMWIRKDFNICELSCYLRLKSFF